jgi:hypothetical protein
LAAAALWVILHGVIRRAVRGLVLAAVWAVVTTSVPLPTLAADEPSQPTIRSGRRYWLEQADRDRDRERQRRQEADQYRRQDDERQRRWSDWWSQRQAAPLPTTPESE